MTVHVVLPTSDGLVWVTDTLAWLGEGSTAPVEKIRYLEKQKIACSSWGDKAWLIRDEFGDRVENGRVTIGAPKEFVKTLRSYAREMTPEAEKDKPQPASYQPRGLIVATFVDHPRLYLAIATGVGMASEIPGNLIFVSDSSNPARLFLDYYLPLCDGSITELLAIGVHAVRSGHTLKQLYVGEPNAWILREGVFRRLTTDELNGYIALSKSIDETFLDQIRNEPPIS